MSEDPSTNDAASNDAASNDAASNDTASDDTASDGTDAAGELSFEDALSRLESIVETLENDPPALDESLDAYEEGVELAQSCLKRLNDAEQRVNELDVDA